MKYLYDLVGMKWVFENPTSGRFLNEMPGVSFRQLEHINDKDNESLLVAWDAIVKNAANGFLFDLKGKLGVSNKMRSGFSSHENTTFSDRLGETGKQLVKSVHLKDNFRFGRLYISSVTLKSEFLSIVSVSIEVDGVEVYSQEHNVTALPTRIEIGEEILSKDAKRIEIYATSDTSLYITNAYRVNSCYDYCYTTRKYHGLAQLILTCDLSLYVEENQGDLLYPYMHRLVLEFLKERIGSDRVNRFTTLNEEKAKELYNTYEEGYKELLSSYIAGMNSSDCICFEKNTPMYSSVSVIP